jgi:hypothetical protein
VGPIWPTPRIEFEFQLHTIDRNKEFGSRQKNITRGIEDKEREREREKEKEKEKQEIQKNIIQRTLRSLSYLARNFSRRRRPQQN